MSYSARGPGGVWAIWPVPTPWRRSLMQPGLRPMCDCHYSQAMTPTMTCMTCLRVWPHWSLALMTHTVLADEVAGPCPKCQTGAPSNSNSVPAWFLTLRHVQIDCQWPCGSHCSAAQHWLNIVLSVTEVWLGVWAWWWLWREWRPSVTASVSVCHSGLSLCDVSVRVRHRAGDQRHEITHSWDKYNNSVTKNTCKLFENYC